MFKFVGTVVAVIAAIWAFFTLLHVVIAALPVIIFGALGFGSYKGYKALTKGDDHHLPY